MKVFILVLYGMSYQFGGSFRTEAACHEAAELYQVKYDCRVAKVVKEKSYVSS